MCIGGTMIPSSSFHWSRQILDIFLLTASSQIKCISSVSISNISRSPQKWSGLVFCPDIAIFVFLPPYLPLSGAIYFIFYQIENLILSHSSFLTNKIETLILSLSLWTALNYGYLISAALFSQTFFLLLFFYYIFALSYSFCLIFWAFYFKYAKKVFVRVLA